MMGLQNWLKQVVAPPAWQRDWETLDSEYRAGHISVHQYQQGKERLLDRRTNWPCPPDLKK